MHRLPKLLHHLFTGSNLWIVWLYLVMYTILACAVVLNRFWQFEIFFFNHGIFDGSLWQMAHGLPPTFDHLDFSRMPQLSDHFNPTLYLLTPLYWFTNAYEPILVIQVLLVSLSAVFIAKTAKSITQNNLMVLAIVMAFTLFIGLQNGLLAGFHPEFIALASFSLAIWAYRMQVYPLMWVGLLLTLGSKESIAPLTAAFGLFLLYRKHLKQGIVLFLISLVWYEFYTKAFIPVAYGRPYYYLSNLPDGVEWFTRWITPTTKVEVILVSLLTFGFLPLAHLGFLPVVIQDFFVRFVLSNGAARWDLGMHYNLMLAIALASGAVFGLKILKRFRWYNKVEWLHAVLVILATLMIHSKTHHGPLQMGLNPVFYQITQSHRFLHELIASVPSGQSVMTMNNLAPHLTHQFPEVYLLRGNLDGMHPDVIVLDLRPGQSPNNFWPLREDTTQLLFQEIQNSGNYETTYHSSDQYVFRRR